VRSAAKWFRDRVAGAPPRLYPAPELTAYKPCDPLTLNRLYGRASGHKLRKTQRELVASLLPQIELPPDGEITSRRLFGDDRPLHLEIGFGSGEHLVHRADMLPDHGFVGAEPFLNGVAAALGHIRDKQLTNIRLWRGDALEVLGRMPDASLGFLYLLHPDPWPKAGHAKRRMVSDGPIDLFAAKLKAGGEFRLATDDPTYLTWSLMIMQRHTHQFEWLVEAPNDFLEPPGGWIETRYGAKSRRDGRRPYYLRYRRK
jgi:tRNA (guanine-N7-)-methyltransferase